MDGSAGQSGITLNKQHILLVEDDKTFGETAGRILQRVGYDVTRATDFRLALAVLEADRRVDMMISDIVMPSSVNGIALTRMARLR
ncbi:MAG TPA: response regulator, partial [Ktedonobacterales bacterium]|nr:response regulator [Ktedonobacterales bacterium]